MAKQIVIPNGTRGAATKASSIQKVIEDDGRRERMDADGAFLREKWSCDDRKY